MNETYGPYIAGLHSMSEFLHYHGIDFAPVMLADKSIPLALTPTEGHATFTPANDPL